VKILILGGTKFIGDALVKKLIKNKINKIDILSKKKNKSKKYKQAISF
jgi:nucleoside-diphosphate-sugar epimerase